MLFSFLTLISNPNPRIYRHIISSYLFLLQDVWINDRVLCYYPHQLRP